MDMTIHKRKDHLSIGRLSAWIIGLAGLCLSLAAWGGLAWRASAAAGLSNEVPVAVHAD